MLLQQPLLLLALLLHARLLHNSLLQTLLLHNVLLPVSPLLTPACADHVNCVLGCDC